MIMISPQPTRCSARVLHPIGAEIVEPGAEVKLRLLDALGWERLRAGGLCPCGGAGSKDHAVSRCLTGADGVIRSLTGCSTLPPCTCVSSSRVDPWRRQTAARCGAF